MPLRTIAAEGAVRENILDNEEPGRGARRLTRRGTSARGICTLAYYLTLNRDKSSGHYVPELLAILQVNITLLCPDMALAVWFNLPESSDLLVNAALFQLVLSLVLCCTRLGSLI